MRAGDHESFTFGAIAGEFPADLSCDTNATTGVLYVGFQHMRTTVQVLRPQLLSTLAAQS